MAPPATEKTEKEGGTDVEKRLAHLEEYGKAKQHQVMELQLELREKDQLQHMYTALSNQLLAEQAKHPSTHPPSCTCTPLANPLF